MANLKAELDEEFEYFRNPLSIPRLKKAVQCALKYERSCLKRLREMDPSCGPPPDVLDETWQKLTMYWSSPEQVVKSTI